MLQTRAPIASRGRAFARFETGFQLAWVGGAIAATAIAVPIQISLAVVAVSLVPAAGLYVRAIRNAEAVDRERAHGHAEVARRRLTEANEWIRRGEPKLAVTELVGLVDVARTTDHHVDPELIRRLDQLRSVVVAGGPPNPDQVAWAMARTSELVTALGREATQLGTDGSTDEDVTVHCDDRRANVNKLVDKSSSER